MRQALGSIPSVSIHVQLMLYLDVVANLDQGSHGDSNPRLLHVKRLSDLQAMRQFSAARRQQGFEQEPWEPHGFEPRLPACENEGPIYKPCANFLRRGASVGSSCGRSRKVGMPRIEFGPQA